MLTAALEGELSAWGGLPTGAVGWEGAHTH